MVWHYSDILKHSSIHQEGVDEADVDDDDENDNGGRKTLPHA